MNFLASAQCRFIRTWHNRPFMGGGSGGSGQHRGSLGMPMGTWQALQKALLQRRGLSPPGLALGQRPHPILLLPMVLLPVWVLWERCFLCLPLPFGEGEGANGAVWWGQEGSDSAPGLKLQCLPSSRVSKPSWGAGCCSYGFEHQEIKS